MVEMLFRENIWYCLCELFVCLDLRLCSFHPLIWWQIAGGSNHMLTDVTLSDFSLRRTHVGDVL